MVGSSTIVQTHLLRCSYLPFDSLLGMFILVTIDDVVVVEPKNLNLSHLDNIYLDVDQRFVGRVLPDVGIVIGIYDIPFIDVPFIQHCKTGAAEIRVTMRLIVFRPVQNEVLVARLESASPQGLRLSLPPFYNSIYVDPQDLMEPSVWDPSSSSWMWEYKDPDDPHATPIALKYVLGNVFYLRVKDIVFEKSVFDTSPHEHYMRMLEGGPRVRWLWPHYISTRPSW